MSKFDPTFLDEVRQRVPISQVIGRFATWDRKKTSAARGDWWAPCPFHGEKNASFHCEDRKGRYHCFGCGVSGDHFRFLTEQVGMTFPQAVAEVASLAGMSLPNAAPLTDEQKAEYGRRMRQREQEAAKRQADDERARQRRISSVKGIWQDTLPLKGTPAEAYLAFRHPRLPEFADENLRFHSGIEHPDTGDQRHPALVARVQDASGKGIAIWRIFLADDGQGKARLPQGSSAKLGLGPSTGGAVRLGGMAKHIALAEGIETSLAVRCLGVSTPCWAALSTSGMVGFKIPAGVERITLFPDRDSDKMKTKERQDGSTFISQPPGMAAAAAFIERNPGIDIRIADGSGTADYLEILQRTTGEPVR